MSGADARPDPAGETKAASLGIARHCSGRGRSASSRAFVRRDGALIGSIPPGS